jgi:hypothetical protein
MGIKLGDISPLAGAISGKGMFGKGLGAVNRALGPMAGIMPRLAGAAQKKDARRAAMEVEMQKGRAGMRGRPMVEDIMMAEQVPAMKKGGEVKKSDIKQDKAMIASAVHKHERAKHKGQPLTKMAKGGSTASKRADGCATKGKTKGRFV